MSLPPQVIQVKRKRTEEGPVPSFLRIEHATNKRHRSDAFFYRRHDPQAAAAAQAAKRAAEAEAEAAGRVTRPPTIQSSKKGDEKRKKPSDSKDDATTATTTNTTTAPAATPPLASLAAAEPRRFHLSRDSLLAAHSSAASVLGVSGAAGVRKRLRYSSAGGDAGRAGSHEPAAVFVERSKRQRKQQLRRSRGGKSSASGSGGVPKTTTAGTTALPFISEPKPAAPLPKRPSRRVGGVAKETGSGASTDGATTPIPADVADTTSDTTTTTTTSSSSKSATPALPPSLRNRQWDTNMDQLTRDMNDYTLELIGRNLAAQQQSQRAAAVAQEQREAARQKGEMSRLANERRRAAYAKFKPKPPGQRYAERQGTAGAADASDISDDTLAAEEDDGDDSDDNDDNDDVVSETDDEDYVTETYVRVPGHEATREAVANGAAVPGSVGLLVFDNEPDLEFFYGVEEDSEEDGEDDEDENAENYYTHDYPEDEVSSDDEYGRDAYHYRTGNASDLEEFSDSDAEGVDNAGDGKGSGEIIGFPGNVRLTKPGDL